MLFTSDRIDILCRKYLCQINCSGGCAICAPDEHLTHYTLDCLDEAAGIDTTGGMQYAVFSAKYVPINPVGRRVTLHEELLESNRCSCGWSDCNECQR